MAVQTEEVKLSNGATITITQSTVMVAMARYRLSLEAKEHPWQPEWASPEQWKDIAFIQSVVYPNIMAAIKKVEGMPWPLTLEQFYTELAETDWDILAAAVQRLNPQWYGEQTPSPKSPTPSTPDS